MGAEENKCNKPLYWLVNEYETQYDGNLYKHLIVHQFQEASHVSYSQGMLHVQSYGLFLAHHRPHQLIPRALPCELHTYMSQGIPICARVRQ